MNQHSDFVSFIRQCQQNNQLVIQPRMGLGKIVDMKQGLIEVKSSAAPTVGTLTIDSYTRVGDYLTPVKCLQKNERLNGFPIMSHSSQAICSMLEEVGCGTGFPVQVRHGTAEPQQIFKRMVDVGLDATEGGPVSYCLPYSRLPLQNAIKAWNDSCRILAGETDCAHIESFGGCLLGQLCPPSMLITISLLECLYFADLGIKSVSMSYAQGTLAAQDRAALKVLNELANRYLKGVDWHVVLYTYMGVYPYSEQGALRILQDSAILAKQTGCVRLIVKTKAESRQIPTVADNLEAIDIAHKAASETQLNQNLNQQECEYYEEIMTEVNQLLGSILNIDSNIGTGFARAFKIGLLDIPYCLHNDNSGKSRSYIDSNGALKWARVGNMPINNPVNCLQTGEQKVTSKKLINMLSYKSSLYDGKYNE